MNVVCNTMVVTAGGVYNQPESNIDVPAEDVPRLLALGAVRLPGTPHPGVALRALEGKTLASEPGIYKVPRPEEY